MVGIPCRLLSRELPTPLAPFACLSAASTASIGSAVPLLPALQALVECQPHPSQPRLAPCPPQAGHFSDFEVLPKCSFPKSSHLSHCSQVSALSCLQELFASLSQNRKVSVFAAFYRLYQMLYGRFLRNGLPIVRSLPYLSRSAHSFSVVANKSPCIALQNLDRQATNLVTASGQLCAGSRSSAPCPSNLPSLCSCQKLGGTSQI